MCARMSRSGSARRRLGRSAAERALVYMGLEAGNRIRDIELIRVFIGSVHQRAPGRYLRAAARVVEGKQVAARVTAIVVPGSAAIRRRAEEGLDRVFTAAGFEWRRAGCSMCLGMNDDVAGPGERVASMLNRNFEGRQGVGARTHLVSPEMAAAAAIAGHFVDVREVLPV